MWLLFCFEFTNFVKILLWLLVWIFVVNLFRSSLISSTTDKKLICSKMLIILTMLCINLHAIQWISQFYLIKWNNLHWNWVDISQTFCPSIFPIISYFAYHPILYKLFPSIMPVFDFTSPNFVPKYPAMDGEIEFLFPQSINVNSMVKLKLTFFFFSWTLLTQPMAVKNSSRLMMKSSFVHSSRSVWLKKSA